MYCANCGTHLNSYDTFCSRCGMKRNHHRKVERPAASPRCNTSYAQPAQQQYVRFQNQPVSPVAYMAETGAAIRFETLKWWSIAFLFICWPFAVYGFLKLSGARQMSYSQAYQEVEKSIHTLKTVLEVILIVYVVLGILAAL